MVESTWKNEFGQSIYRVCKQVSQPKACIGFVHGLGEHIGRYQSLFEFYSANQFSVYGFDSVGFGKSEGKRGHVHSQLQWLKEITMLIDWMQEENPNTTIVLYGHSLGGQKVLNYCLQGGNLPNCCVASSPFIEEGTKTASLKLSAGKLLSHVFPALTIKNGLQLNGLSRNPQIIEDYLNDQLCTTKVSLRLATLSFQAADWLREGKHEIIIPLLLTHGTADSLTNWEATRKFGIHLKGKEVSFYSWQDGYHELHNDIVSEDYNQKVLNWITRYA